MPNGLKIQWGTATIASINASSNANAETQTFQVPYTNVPSISIISQNPQCTAYCGGVDSRVVIPACRNWSTQTMPSVKLYWIAIGY